MSEFEKIKQHADDNYFDIVNRKGGPNRDIITGKKDRMNYLLDKNLKPVCIYKSREVKVSPTDEGQRIFMLDIKHVDERKNVVRDHLAIKPKRYYKARKMSQRDILKFDKVIGVNLYENTVLESSCKEAIEELDLYFKRNYDSRKVIPKVREKTGNKYSFSDEEINKKAKNLLN